MVKGQKYGLSKKWIKKHARTHARTHNQTNEQTDKIRYVANFKILKLVMDRILTKSSSSLPSSSPSHSSLFFLFSLPLRFPLLPHPPLSIFPDLLLFSSLLFSSRLVSSRLFSSLSSLPFSSLLFSLFSSLLFTFFSANLKSRTTGW